jgi:hypothetical protein
MKRRSWYSLTPILILFLLLSSAAVTGCARAARDTTGFAVTDSTTANLSFNEAWQQVKAVLREQDYEIYTRDKRGVFVAFSGSKRSLVQYHRIKLTIALEAVSETATKVSVDTLRQVYGVTLLTYPGWHDRKTQDHTRAQALLKAIEAKAAKS